MRKLSFTIQNVPTKSTIKKMGNDLMRTFTIQNVPIKSKADYPPQVVDRNLQYKMFLLNWMTAV